MTTNPHETAQGVTRLPLEREQIHEALRFQFRDAAPLTESEWLFAVNAWLVRKWDRDDIAASIYDARVSGEPL